MAHCAPVPMSAARGHVPRHDPAAPSRRRSVASFAPISHVASSGGRSRAFTVVAIAVTVLAASFAHGVQSASAAGPTVSVIVLKDRGAGDAAERLIAAGGGRVERRLRLVNGFSASVPAGIVGRLEATAGVASVAPDAPLRPLGLLDGYDGASTSGSMYNVARQIGAGTYWNNGFTGKGIDIAVIDTGVNPVEGLRATGKIVNGPDLSFERHDPNVRHLDTYGHGTHMAGIIAGRDGTGLLGALLPDADDLKGIAPHARIVNVKVANAMGATDVSQVIAAIDWVVQHKNANGMNIRVLNLSFGTDGTQDYRLDPLAFAAEQAWHHGIVVVAAAGNAGFGSAKLNDPAYDPYVIAVGADDTRGTTRVTDDVIPAFSSTGDTKRNPDLVAPGKSIVSLRVRGSRLDQAHPEGRVNDRFFKGSGTSQAAAVVSGAAAVILQQRPHMTPDQVKRLLVSSARPLPNTDQVAQGAGLVDLAEAYSIPTDATYVQDWPRATGTGSLEAARGSLHVADPNGVELRGDIDIFGAPFDSATWAARCADAAAWSGDDWNGNAWGSDSWSGNSWSGNSWSGNSWSGNSWSGNSWSGNSWSGNSWSGNSWSGNSWSGNSWSGKGWLGVSWGRAKKPVKGAVYR